MTTGDRIRELRERLGYSVSDVAKRLGKNRATVYRYESDYIENMPVSVLEPIARILGTTPAFLMGWEDDASTSATCAETLTDEEKRMLAAYRMADVNARIYALEILEAHQVDENSSIRAAIAASEHGSEIEKRRTR